MLHSNNETFPFPPQPEVKQPQPGVQLVVNRGASRKKADVEKRRRHNQEILFTLRYEGRIK